KSHTALLSPNGARTASLRNRSPTSGTPRSPPRKPLAPDRPSSPRTGGTATVMLPALARRPLMSTRSATTYSVSAQRNLGAQLSATASSFEESSRSSGTSTANSISNDQLGGFACISGFQGSE